MKSRCGTDILKGVYNALVLTIRNPEKISKVLSRTKQRRCPVGVLYTYSKNRIAIGISISYGNYRYRGCVIHIGVGLLRCSFRQDGQFSGASNREASNYAGLHAFFVPYCKVRQANTMHELKLDQMTHKRSSI